MSLKLNHIKSSDVPRVGRYVKHVNNTAAVHRRAFEERGGAELLWSRAVYRQEEKSLQLKSGFLALPTVSPWCLTLHFLACVCHPVNSLLNEQWLLLILRRQTITSKIEYNFLNSPIKIFLNIQPVMDSNDDSWYIFPALNPRKIWLCFLRYKLLSKGILTCKNWITNNIKNGPIPLKFRVNHDTNTVTSIHNTRAFELKQVNRIQEFTFPTVTCENILWKRPIT